MSCVLFLSHSPHHLCNLHSFPTRRSSDLDIRVVPLERHGECNHVEIADRFLRFERKERNTRCELLFQLLFWRQENPLAQDRKSTRLNSSHRCISYAVSCLKKKHPSTPPHN